MVRTDKTLEITGTLSARGQSMTRETLSKLVRGQILTVVTTDRSARHTLSLLCEALGSTVIGVEDERGTLYVHIRR